LIPHLSERGLILAPHGRDAEVAASMLAEAKVRSVICSSLTELLDGLKAGAGFALVTEEALHTADLHPLADWISGQPEWSDFPFVLLTLRGGGIERNRAGLHCPSPLDGDVAEALQAGSHRLRGVAGAGPRRPAAVRRGARVQESTARD